MKHEEKLTLRSVIPAKAGIQFFREINNFWIPLPIHRETGMTISWDIILCLFIQWGVLEIPFRGNDDQRELWRDAVLRCFGTPPSRNRVLEGVFREVPYSFQYIFFLLQ